VPVVPAGDLTTLRTFPHASKLYMVVQQPMRQSAGVWTGYLWAGQINGAIAGDAGDLVADLTLDNGEVGDGGANVQLYAGMTIFIGTTKGDHDKGIFYLRSSVLATAATVALDIGSSSQVVDVVEDDDWVVVLQEYRIWTRYPRITEAGGVISWYKDYDVTYASLGGDAASRREASLPPVPVMGPHRVQFIDQGGSVDIDFDWSDSYATYAGAAVDTWTSHGERGASGDWNLAVQNPAAQTYDGSAVAANDISGLAGYQVDLRVQHDETDPDARFERGFRFVFTLRRPGETVTGIDPANAEPITDFSVSSVEGSWDEGGWRTSVTIFDTQASEISIIEGALVIIFADDFYGGTRESVGPISGAENILMCGYIADGSVSQDPETGDVSFDILSAAGIMKNREMYPIPVEYDDGADEWYKCPGLTTDRAAWFYICWHSTVATVCDWYWNEDTEYIKAMDFLAGDLYSTIDSFYEDRLMARLLCDRYGRLAMPTNLQLGAAAAGTTLFTLADGDWLEQVEFRETIETPVSIAEMGGLNYNAGLVTPYLAKAPGTVNRQMGSNQSNMNLAVADQATLNTMVGRWLAALNNRWPESVFPFGNWRVFDIWPQEYINVTQETIRHDFSGDLFIPRQISMTYDGGAVSVTVQAELENDGADGQTIDIPDEVPTRPIPRIPMYPPSVPPTPTSPSGSDDGVRIIATDVGVYYTPNIGAVTPVWIQTNNGFVTDDDKTVWDIKRDPFEWWTSGGTERTLWAATKSGVWKMEDWPHGTWVNIVTEVAIEVWTGAIQEMIYHSRMDFSIEVEGRFGYALYDPGGIGRHKWHYLVVQDGVIQNCYTPLPAGNYYNYNGWPDVKWGQHSGGQILYGSRPSFDPFVNASLYRTINAGGAWATIDNTPANLTDVTSLSVPYVDASNPDSYILWGGEGASNLRISIDGGATFNALDPAIDGMKIGTGGHPDYIFLLNADFCYWSQVRGVSWNMLPDLGYSGGLAGSMPRVGTWTKWSNGVLQEVIVGADSRGGTDGRIWQWKNGSGSWLDKTGNLKTSFSVAQIYQVDRDSMGTA